MPFEQLPCRRAALAAFACVGFHVLAAAGTMGVLRHGLPPAPPEERLAWLASHAPQWRGAWLLWTASAATFFLFIASATRALGPGLAALAAGITAAAGLVPDVGTEIVYILKYPASSGALGYDLMLLRERDRQAAFLAGGLANGLYTVAWGILAARAWRTPGFPRALTWAALPGLLAGAALSVAGFLNWARGLAAATAAVIPLFTLWCLGAGLFFWMKSRAADTMSPP